MVGFSVARVTWTCIMRAVSLSVSLSETYQGKLISHHLITAAAAIYFYDF